jgi:protein arginine kinase activator
LCGKNEATVHLTEMINDQTRELHLCEPCAREKGAAASPFGLAELLAGLADFGTRMEEAAKPKPTCPQCKMTYDDFRKTGRLGCGECYETFHRYLSPLLKRIHGSTRHVGRGPTEVAPRMALAEEDLPRLKERLKGAIAAEEFEEAAHLRDRIRALESKKKRVKGEG